MMVASAESPVLNHMQLKDLVYEHLRRSIIEGEYEVGAALREVDISTSLGVSKTPVREALVRLQSDRFVELIPYRGAVVTGYSRRDVREMYEVREIVEGRCAARMAEADDDGARDELQNNLKDTWDAVSRGDVDAVIDLFEKFDGLIYAHAENRWFADLIDDLEGHQRRIGRPTVEIPGRIETSTRQHQAICDAILARDAETAEAAMREHVRSVLADRLGNFPDDDAA
jgi:DNA-binding GntR family transcriptional regulator